MRKSLIAGAALACALSLSAHAQMPLPGAHSPAKVESGDYAVETAHTNVEWTLNHMGFNSLFGLFGGATGSLHLDVKHPAQDAVTIHIPMSAITTTSDHLSKHMASDDFFAVAKYSSADFVSTKVVTKGSTATIMGNLTLHGVTKPVVLHAQFVGAGTNPMSKKVTVGFHATAHVKRSAFGLGYAVPVVGDDVELKISAAFEK
jgi:polyisoprenoid-binding protein YceI